MGDTIEMPLFPLGTVLFPDGWLPLRIFEPRYVEMTKACLRAKAPFGVVLIHAGFETGIPAVPWQVGCSARIVECEASAPQHFALLCRGKTRFRILDRQARSDGLLTGHVALLPALPAIPLPASHAALEVLWQRLLRARGLHDAPAPDRQANAPWIAYRIAECLPVTPERKQRLLECTTLDALLAGLAAELQALESADAG
ncbi:MAG TPA: LON peptidase substrate-binding domain-containing protein [Nevskiaceae bacterium]|nr:LON peptidase substrate-binding domain-containing protein [Nevskiaceae bacterium]